MLFRSASFRHSAPQRVLVQLAGFLCGLPAEYFDMIADFKCVLDKRKTLVVVQDEIQDIIIFRLRPEGHFTNG